MQGGRLATQQTPAASTPVASSSHSRSVTPVPERQDCQITGCDDLGLLQKGNLPKSGQRLLSHLDAALGVSVSVEHLSAPAENQAQRMCWEQGLIMILIIMIMIPRGYASA